DSVDVEGRRLHEMLHYQSSKRSYEQRRIRGRIDIAADLAGSHSFFDQLLHRHPKFTVRLRHLASNLPERTERLADQHVHRVAIARCGHAQTSLCRDDQRFHPMEPCQRGLQQFCELTLQALGHGAYQRALRSEPMAYEPDRKSTRLNSSH